MKKKKNVARGETWKINFIIRFLIEKEREIRGGNKKFSESNYALPRNLGAAENISPPRGDKISWR